MSTESTDSATQMFTTIYTVEVTEMLTFYENETVGEPDPGKNNWLPMEFQIGALWFLFAIGVLGNLLVFQWMRFNRHRKSRVNTIVLGIASADLSVCLFAILATAIIETSVVWKAGNVLCKIVMFFQGAALISSGNMIAVMAIDRHQAVRSPLSAFVPAWKLVVGGWTIAGVLALPQFLVWLVKEKDGREYCGTNLQAQLPRTAYLTYVAFITFLIPFVVITVAYVRLCKTIWDKARECSGKSGKKRDGQIELRRVPTGTLTKAKKKTLKMTIVIIACFVLCGSPYFIVEMLKTYHVVTSNVYPLFSIFAVSNSAVNPYVFLFFNVSLRFWKDMFPCFAKASPEATYNRYSVKFSSSNSRQQSKSFSDPHTRVTDLESGVTINCID